MICFDSPDIYISLDFASLRTGEKIHIVVEHIAFGIIVDDIVYPDGTTHMGVLGGGGPQTAWGMAAALGSGSTVGLVAGIGDDLDEHTLAPLTAAQIDQAGGRRTDLPTPRAWQVLEFDGTRRQVWRVPGQILGRQLARNRDILPESYQAARSLHWGIHPGDTSSLDFARELEAAGQRVSLEPFKAPDTPLSEDALYAMVTACTIYSPNWEEATRLVGSEDYATVVARFKALDCRYLVLRRGADGADAWDLDTGEGVHVPAYDTAVVDVVGAGNAFCGAFTAQFDAGIKEALCHASTVASYMVEQVGIPPALPDAADYAQRRAVLHAQMEALTL